MTLAVNEYNRTYHKGISLSYDLKQLIVSFLLHNGANPTTSAIPRGLVLLCARTYKVTKPTVFSMWRKYCFNGQLETDSPQTSGLCWRILSEEDHKFVERLVLLDPTIYKWEIRDKLYQYSNTPPRSISIPTLSRTVQHRLRPIKWTRKRVQRSNRDRWNYGNILYTRNFMDHVSSYNPYDIRFIDKCGFNINSGIHYYGSWNLVAELFTLPNTMLDQITHCF